MRIAFYLDEMNLRGVANSTYLYALNNIIFLKNKSYIFYNKKNKSNKKEVIKKFKEKFITFGVSTFKEIDSYHKNYNFDFLYVQKGGEKDNWNSKEIKTVVHSMYPQKIKEVHGFKYAFISEWLSLKFTNNKIPNVPYIVKTFNTSGDLRKRYNIKKNSLVLGCHGGESSFDLKFVKDAVIKTAEVRKDIVFLFLNISKFFTHPRIKFIKGTTDEKFKRRFINSCDFMIYGRSLGESFGLACGEFAIHNKKIISYKFNRHNSHKYNCPKENFIEYSSFENLFKILLNLKKIKKVKKKITKYHYYKTKKIMHLFKKVFLTKEKKIQFSFFDYLTNYKSYLFMNYSYLRHKLYNQCYNYILSKINKFRY